jgi:hypothetical protein
VNWCRRPKHTRDCSFSSSTRRIKRRRRKKKKKKKTMMMNKKKGFGRILSKSIFE